MDKRIYDLLKKIELLGYEAYVVGGYVRDFLLNIKTNDVDIATNMNISLLKETFKDVRIYDEYLCVKFNIDELNISITTYRIENGYMNNKPLKVCSTNNINEDAQRRDFTINALYMNKNGEIVDPLNGKKDIDNKVIKVIGDIDTRLKEDKTRILRCLRFMSIYNFKLEDNLYKYIINNKNLISDINYEKRKSELDKIFNNKNFSIFLNFIKENNIEKYFDIKFDEIRNANNYLEVWSFIKYGSKYNFTREEQKIIEKLKND